MSVIELNFAELRVRGSVTYLKDIGRRVRVTALSRLTNGQALIEKAQLASTGVHLPERLEMLVGNVNVKRGEASTPLPLELALEQAGNVFGGDPKRDPIPVVPEAQVGFGLGQVLAALLAVLVMTEQGGGSGQLT